MSFFSVTLFWFIVTVVAGYIGALAAVAVITGLLRMAIRRLRKVSDPDPNEMTFPTEVPWV